MTTLLAFGDSITWGAWDTQGGWVARLRKEIDKKNLSDPEFYCSVYNLGISGETSSALLKRFALEAKNRIKIEQEKPIIFIATGTNDAKVLLKKKSNQVSLEEYRKNIAQLVIEAKKLTSKILFLTPPKVNEANVNTPPKNTERLLYNKDLARYALAVEEITQKEGLPCLNVYKFFDDSTMLNNDGIHPNDKGHEKIYQEVRKILRQSKILSL